MDRSDLDAVVASYETVFREEERLNEKARSATAALVFGIVLLGAALVWNWGMLVVASLLLALAGAALLMSLITPLREKRHGLSRLQQQLTAAGYVVDGGKVELPLAEGSPPSEHRVSGEAEHR